MEKLIKELEQVIEFKETIDIGDVVLILIEESQNGVYAYVTSIEKDDSRKDEWWHVGLAFLSIPVQHTTWTLRTPQMTGQEVFTMGGKKRFVKPLLLIKDRGTPRVVKELKDQVVKKESFLKRVK